MAVSQKHAETDPEWWNQTLDSMDADVQMVLDVLSTIEPPLKEETSVQMARALREERVNLPTLAKLGHAELAGEPFNIKSSVERARIIATVASTPTAPPPTDLFGGPVVVYPKIGFTRLDSFDTVNSTVTVRFFLDLYWTDPRVKGKSYVPDGMWRPDGVLIINRTEDMDGVAHESKPVIADPDPDNDGKSKNGLLLWPVEYAGTITNPMALRGFPFDFDSVIIKLQQPEEASAHEFIFRPYEDPVDEYNAVRFFFDVGGQLSEWQLLGHSVAVWESIGGIPKPFAQMQLSLHFARKWQYYFWKVVVPLETCTLLCFSTFAFMPNELADRTAISTTMFLATCALLYVIGAELPKISHLTPIDYLVISSLMIQLVIVIVGVATGGSLHTYSGRRELIASAGSATTTDFFPISIFRMNTDLAEGLDFYSLWVMIASMFLSLFGFFVWPAIVRSMGKPTDWPKTIVKPKDATLTPYTNPDGKLIGYGYEQPIHPSSKPGANRQWVRYFFFEKFANIFPNPEPGDTVFFREADPSQACLAMQYPRKVAMEHAKQGFTKEEQVAQAAEDKLTV